jgi:membrane associated rhomboid family serine protease
VVAYLLIGLNVAVSLWAFSSFKKGMSERFLFAPYKVASGRSLQGMLLSNFSHADAGHLLFNMLTLYFFAPVIEYGLGAAGLLAIYAVAGACSALFIYVFHRRNPDYRALGASGSVSGVIFGAIVLQPGMSIYFFMIPIPIPAPVFAVGYILLSTYLMRRGAGNVSHEAHIGGALAGFLLAGILYGPGYEPLLQRMLRFIP